jgi:glutamate dehydrogenase
MPFLVDSLIGAMAVAEVGIHLVVHPQVVVQRDEAGRLQRVGEYSGAAAQPPEIVESWTHLGVDRQSDAAVLQQLHDRVLRVLADVAAAVEDWQSMGDAVRDAGEELRHAKVPGLTPQVREEAIEFLDWLARGHFTMLGYREYRLTGEVGHERLVMVPDTGLGILREDTSSRGHRGELPGPARRHARDPFPLIITKANSRATVHRNSYLDYIGVKVFDQRGEVIGERRLLGLFTATAYARSVKRIASAVGEGSMAVQFVHQYLGSL